MSDDPMSDEQQQAWAQVAADLAQLFSAGRSPSEVTKMLVEQGWPYDTARDFVSDVHQQWQQWANTPEGQAALAEPRGIDFSERFPDLRPVSRVPGLFTFNGIGLAIYGARDHDAQTDSYVKTHCICFVFLPIFALGAYRVIQAPSDGWYFLGREPLSLLAKAWNLLVVLTIIGFIGVALWDQHKQSPSYLAGRKMAQADKAAADGNLEKAAQWYAEVAQGQTPHSPSAVNKLSGLLQEVAQSPPGDQTAEAVFGFAVQVQRGRGGLADTFPLAVQLAQQRAAESPVAALRLLRTVGPLQPDDGARLAVELLAAHGSHLSLESCEEACRIAVEIGNSSTHRQELFAWAAEQAERFAAEDVSSGVAVLSVIAPLETPEGVAAALDNVLAGRFESLSPSAARTTLESAWQQMPAQARPVMAHAALGWLTVHADAEPRAALQVLDVLQILEEPLAKEVETARRALLEAVVAVDPADADAALRLALLLEQEGDTNRIVALLMPLSDHLGQGEGPRVLGQALARQGSFDKSYAMLQPWVEQRLAALHAAEEAYSNRYEELQQRVLSQLQAGNVAGFDYRRYATVTEDGRIAMIMGHVNERAAADPSLAAAREDLVRYATVVPVALDLGIVTLRRAQSLSDPDVRQAELEKAETTFLAIRGIAGDDDRYRLFLGQVYYWLGRQEDGRQLFDELLESQGRSHSMLVQLAHVMRDLGASRDARELLEEAYAKAEEDEEKQVAARFRAITPTDLEDRITWLKRSDQREPSTQAELASALGDQAAQRGDEAAAARHYRNSIALYRKLPETVGSLNNGSLVLDLLYSVTGDHATLDEGLQWLEKAAALQPGDPVVQSNLATRLLERGLAELAGDHVDLRRQRLSLNFAALNALVTDAAAMGEMHQRVRDNATIRRARDVLETVMVLAPKSERVYGLALSLYGYTNDVDALRGLAERIAAADLEPTEAIRWTLQGYQESEPDAAERWERDVEHYGKLVAEFRDAGRQADFALAARALNRLRMQPAVDDTPIDADAIVDLAEQADANRSTYTTKMALVEALAFRGNRTLGANDSEWAAQCRECQRLFDARTLAAIALNRSGPLGTAARENPDLQRAAELTAGRIAEFPDTSGPIDWAFLRHLQPEAAEQAAEQITTEKARLVQRISRQLMPVSATNALHEFWQQTVLGNEAAGRQAIQSVRDAGVPIPDGVLD